MVPGFHSHWILQGKNSKGQKAPANVGIGDEYNVLQKGNKTRRTQCEQKNINIRNIAS